MTVTNLVCEFMEAGIMRMAGTESAGVGRKAELIEVVPDSLITIGVLLTHHGLIVAGVGLDGTQYQTEHMVTDAAISLDELYGKICRGIDGVIRALPGRNFGGIVISTLGCVDSATNTLELQAFYPNVGRVTGLDKLLGEKYGMTVISENDANVAALAELYYSPQPTPQTFIYVQIDEGIGSGLITEGKLFSEANSFAGELGHMTICHDGLPCRCGNRGCLERYISTTAICEWYGERTGKSRVSWESFMESMERGEPEARRTLERACEFLASGLVNLINIVDAERIYIGDRGADIIAHMVEYLEAEVNRRRFLKKNIRICPASFSKEARIMGVAPLWIERTGMPEQTRQF